MPVGRDAGAPFPGGALGQLQARAIQPLLDIMSIAPATPVAFFIMLFGLVLALVLALLAAGWLGRAGQLAWAGSGHGAPAADFGGFPGEMRDWRARLLGGMRLHRAAAPQSGVDMAEEPISQSAVLQDTAPLVRQSTRTQMLKWRASR